MVDQFGYRPGDKKVAVIKRSEGGIQRAEHLFTQLYLPGRGVAKRPRAGVYRKSDFVELGQ
jgi:hypothetical protein